MPSDHLLLSRLAGVESPNIQDFGCIYPASVRESVGKAECSAASHHCHMPSGRPILTIYMRSSAPDVQKRIVCNCSGAQILILHHVRDVLRNLRTSYFVIYKQCSELAERKDSEREEQPALLREEEERLGGEE